MVSLTGQQVDGAREPGLPGRTLVTALLCASSGALPVMMAGALVVQITEGLDISEGRFGLGVSTLFLTSALVSMWSGRVADDLGWGRATQLASVLSATSLLLIAVVAESFAVFVLAMAVGGLGQSVAMPTSNLALVREVPRHRHGLAFGIKQTANPVASLLAGISIPAVAVTIGWRWAFAFGLAMPVAALLLAGGRGRGTASREERAQARSHAAAYERRPLVLLAVGGGLAGLSVSALSTFVVASAVTSGIDVGVAGVFVSIASLTGLMVRLLSGWVADRRGSRGLRPVAAFLVVGTLGFGLLATQEEVLVLPGMMLAYGAGWGWPGLFHLGVAAHHPEAPASATGVVQSGVLLGSALGPTVVGVMATAVGYRPVWLVVAGLVLMGASLVVEAARTLETDVGRLPERP